MSTTQNPQYLDLETVQAFLADDHIRLASEIEPYANAHISTLPTCTDDTAAREQARSILGRLGQGGWLRYAVPEEFGGASETIDLRACCLIREALAARSPLADAVFALQCLGSMPLAMAASPDRFSGSRTDRVTAAITGNSISAISGSRQISWVI